MSETVVKGKRDIFSRLLKLLDFKPSEKLKFSIKTALAMTLAYIIPFSQGWEQAQTAVITIMLIAVAGPVSESIAKGLYRVIGTVIGAIVGMTLIAIFPQDRMLYLIFLSICVTFTLYLTRAYKGDNTIFMLTSITMMMVFKDGQVDEIFIFGIDKTFMTLFGILVYTLISVFIWPVKSKTKTLSSISDLCDAQDTLYKHKDAKSEETKKAYQTLREKESELELSVISPHGEEDSLSTDQKNTLLLNAKEINELLILLSYHELNVEKDLSLFITNYSPLDEEIKDMFAQIKRALGDESQINIPKEWSAQKNMDEIKKLSHIDKAALTATISDTAKLHTSLRSLCFKINSVNSNLPTHFKIVNIAKPSMFNWLDPEDLKGTLITFIIFWTSTAFWIYFNPPAGFMIVALATGLSVITTFSPLKPSLLIIIFTISFIFATSMYVFVLPHIVGFWDLALFLFAYAFIGFYFIKPMLSIFFLLGMAVLGLGNPMYFNFNLFLLILFMFYLFLFVLLLFYYIPFSTKPEVLFLSLKKRFFNYSYLILKKSRDEYKQKSNILDKIELKYAKQHLIGTVKKMQLWASKVDDSYFDEIEKEKLIEFTKSCETFAYLLLMVTREEQENRDNPLLNEFMKKDDAGDLWTLLKDYAEGKDVDVVSEHWDSVTTIQERGESMLSDFISSMQNREYKDKEIVTFYENIALRKNVWMAFFLCQKQMKALNFNSLKESRF